MIDIIRFPIAVTQVKEVLNHRRHRIDVEHTVVQWHAGSQLTVDDMTPNLAQVIAFRIKKQTVEQRFRHLNSSRFGRTHLAVKIQQGFFFIGRVVTLKGVPKFGKTVTKNRLHILFAGQPHDPENLGGRKIAAAIHIGQQNII